MSGTSRGSSADDSMGKLRFPEANFTAIELLTFLPGCLNSPDIVFRFASNGVTFDAILSIVNTNRALQQAWNSEYCYRTARNAMRHAGHGDWTLRKHSQYFEDRLQSWNPANLNVGGLRTSFTSSGELGTDADIPFARLADGVKHMPQGDDALDLTRMIQHCLQNSSEAWMYPSNYDVLLAHLGGPKKPSAANEDSATFARWEHVIPQIPRPRKPNERTLQLKIQAPGQSSTPQTDAQVPRRSGRRGRPSLKKRELEEEELLGAEVKSTEDHNEDYEPGPMRWVKPPIAGGTMSFQALHYAFETQPSHTTNDHFDAYAFGSGPRLCAPFRPLHLITVKNLKCDDLSGWAENLRWAAEQNSTFGETGWTECPEHMEQIAEIRQRQTWASAELAIVIMDNQEEEEEDETWVKAMVEGTIASMDRREPNERLWVWGDVAEEYVDAQGRLQLRWRPWPRR